MANRRKAVDSNEEGRLVYSTAGNLPFADLLQSIEPTLPEEQQELRIAYERAGRGGKEVTLIRGFVGAESDLKALAKKLKNSCACGGAVKNGEILLQGDKRTQIKELLHQWGYVRTK